MLFIEGISDVVLGLFDSGICPECVFLLFLCKMEAVSHIKSIIRHQQYIEEGPFLFAQIQCKLGCRENLQSAYKLFFIDLIDRRLADKSLVFSACLAPQTSSLSRACLLFVQYLELLKGSVDIQTPEHISDYTRIYKDNLVVHGIPYTYGISSNRLDLFLRAELLCKTKLGSDKLK